MEFRVLGPLEVVGAEGAVVLASGRQAALLACLLLRANEVVSRDVLIDALWGESPPASAANALQVQVHALRRRLGAERIRTEGPGYVLAVEPGELDLERFERLLERGRGELSSGEPEAAAATLAEALALWRGPALVDVADRPFARSETTRIEELRLTALEEKFEAELALARHAELVPELETLVAVQPLRERLHGQLMLALYRSGRQTDAVAAFGDARRILDERLGLEPGPELRALHEAVLRQDVSLLVEPPELRGRRHLPAPQNELVGRRRELDDLGDLIRRRSARLVTLTGPGGSGKTRLALGVAHDAADAFEHGVHFVDLAGLREPMLVPTTVARALGVEEESDRLRIETLRAHLSTRRLLLVLDNFEVVEDAAPVLGELLAGAPGLSLLVTSRTPLRLSSEHEYRVGPLPVDDAANLFVTRARAVAPAFRRPSAEAADVAEICRRLDCLPLALELAAARTRDHSVGELLELLPHALDLASAGPRDLPERQRTLRATIEWSYELLSPNEQSLFTRLAVFPGGCTSAAIDALFGPSRESLDTLVASSLLSERPGHDGKPRFSMLETVRDYALERLEESGAGDSLRRRHAEYYADLAESGEKGNAPETTHALLDEELDNIRAALVWSNAANAVDLELRIVGALPRFWLVRGHMREGRVRVEAALAHADGAPAPLRAKALWSAARVAQGLADYESMRNFSELSLDVYRCLDDEQGTAWAIDRLAQALMNLGELERATALYEESIAIFRDLDDDVGLGVTLTNLSSVSLMRDDAGRASALAAEALALSRKLGRRWGVVPPLSNLGLAAIMQNRLAEGIEHCRQSIRLAHELEYSEGLICGLIYLATGVAAAGEAERAAALIAATDATVERTNYALELFERDLRAHTLETVTGTLGADAFAAAYASGGELGTDDIVALALEGPPTPGSSKRIPVPKQGGRRGSVHR